MSTIQIPLNESKIQKFTVKAVYEDGTPIKNIQARFIIPISENYDLVFHTTVDNKKQCASFNIPPLNKFFNEETLIKGAKLEVIADDQVYTPIVADVKLYEPVKVSAEISQTDEEVEEQVVPKNKVQAEIIDESCKKKNNKPKKKSLKEDIADDLDDFSSFEFSVDDLI